MAFGFVGSKTLTLASKSFNFIFSSILLEEDMPDHSDGSRNEADGEAKKDAVDDHFTLQVSDFLSKPVWV